MYSELGAATTNVHIRVSRHATMYTSIAAPGWIPNPRSTNSGEIWHVDAHWPPKPSFASGGRAEGGIPPPQKKMPGINVGQLGSCAVPGTRSLRRQSVYVGRTEMVTDASPRCHQSLTWVTGRRRCLPCAAAAAARSKPAAAAAVCGHTHRRPYHEYRPDHPRRQVTTPRHAFTRIRCGSAVAR